MTKARDLATSGPSGGLVLIKPGSVVNGTDNGNGTISFSGASSVSLNDVFSATYDNYRIVLNNFTGSAGALVSIRLRVGGVDASATNYNRQFLLGNNTTMSALRDTGLSSFEAIARTQTTTPMRGDIFLVNPFQATPTAAQMQDDEGQVGTNIRMFIANFNHTLSTSYDGFTLICSSGTMTGSVSVYGYRK